jgi:predicted transcriptional regulator
MNAAASSFELDKKRIIQWVQGISEPKLLERIKYLMASESDADWRDDISEDERKAIEEGIQQINAGQWVSHEEVKNSYAKWL